MSIIMKTVPAFLSVFASALLLTPNARSAPVSLFDGKTLDGWDYDPKVWRVEDGMITGGSRTEKIRENFFIATKKSYQNFELVMKIKCSGDPATGMINSGIQVRSVRVPGGNHMSGYQVDCGAGWFGKIYDEFRRNRVIAEPVDAVALAKVVDVFGWNTYRIRAEGPRIRTWINDVLAIDFTETDRNIALDGQIGPQVHSGGVCLVQVKDVTVEELPATPGAPTWQSLGGVDAARKLITPAPKKKQDEKKKAEAPPDTKATKSGRDISYNALNAPAQSPEEQRKSFKLPPGFEMELVAAESEGLGKFIAVDWDASGRMWSMTALEYPVDANENKAASDALFARGGRDRVVVFDVLRGGAGQPLVGGSPVPLRYAAPRIFADNLVMPLGVLPYKDGAFVQYGTDIRFYRDTNGDGRADKFDVILTGFGTQDSHLFPHQFTRTFGGYVLLAQGLFNYSTVRRPEGKPFADGVKEVVFNQCKLARFTLDGSRFENLTSGPNNIWGMTISREGETWLQEANDIGRPIVPYEPGTWVVTGSKDRLRPYQPLQPATLNPPQMGGTGLSGLALADDRGTAFKSQLAAEAGAKVFFVANPITSTINAIKATPDGPRYRYEKLPDFITTADRWFRPVAIAFGPDGCLYITDWYNKIISHNEVPRAHPDRDKTRGRIWRVRHTAHNAVAPPDLTKLPEKELLAQLGTANARVARLAWLELIDRNATVLTPDLEKIATDKTASPDRRLGAVWALEGLKPVPAAVLSALAADANFNLRHEAARIAAAQPRAEAEFLALATPLVTDPHPSVRAAVGDALRRVPNASPRMMALAAKLGREPLATASEWDKYDRDFERYLARWAMELNPQSTAALLASSEGKTLPLENRLLATLSLDAKSAALGLAQLMTELKRPLLDEEIRILTAQLGEPAVTDALKSALANPASRAGALDALLKFRTSLDPAKLLPLVVEPARTLLASANASDLALGTRLASEFQIASLEPQLAKLVESSLGSPQGKLTLLPEVLTAVRALASLRSDRTELFAKLMEMGDASAREAALAALAASKSTEASAKLIALWTKLNSTERTISAERLASTKPGAQALLASLRDGSVKRDEVGLPALERMHTLLAGDPQMEELWREAAAKFRRVLRLGGGNDDYVSTKLTLAGPFTVEAWVKLAGDISNHDGIFGLPGNADFNFAGAQFRVYGGPAIGDLVIAKKKTVSDAWTHYAASRDAQGVFRIYINGELDATGTKTTTNTFANLDVARTTPLGGGTDGWLAEFRVWNTARTPAEIRDNFDRSFSGEALSSLKLQLSGTNWGKLNGKARVEPTTDSPTLLTAAEAQVQAAKFAQFRTLAEQAGDVARGKELFTTLCHACHQLAGKGGQIAPPLDGVSHSGIEALLRNILTPNAAMEGGYRKFRVETKDNELQEGMLVSQDTSAIVLRQPNAPDTRISRANVRKAEFTNLSVMPEGLLEAMKPSQVSDLFAFLKTLR